MDVSVVVVTRNRLPYLRKCVLSLLRQTVLPREIVIVDDHSDRPVTLADLFEEHTLEMLYRIKNVDIVIARNEKPSGIILSRNLGIRLSRSDVVAFIDDDGFAHRNWIRNLLKDYSNGVVGVGGPIVEVGRKIRGIRRRVRSAAYISPDGDVVAYTMVRKLSEIRFLRKQKVKFLNGGNMSFLRKVLIKARGGDLLYDGNAYREETDLAMKVSGFGDIIFDPAVITYHNTAKFGGNRERISGKLEIFLKDFFKNTSYLFLKHFHILEALGYTKSLAFRYASFAMKDYRALPSRFGRRYLRAKGRLGLLVSIFSGILSGFMKWVYRQFHDEVFITSWPSSIEAYTIAGGFVFLESRTLMLRRFFGI